MNKKTTDHALLHAAEGTAALGICESLLLALTDLKIISELEAGDLLAEVAAAHTDAAAPSRPAEEHQAVVKIVQGMLAGKDWVRR